MAAKITLVSSRMALALHWATVLAALAAVVNSAVPLGWCLALLLLLFILGIWGARQLRALSSQQWLYVDGRCIEAASQCGGEPVVLEVRRGWQFAPWLLQLRYRYPSQRRWRSLLLWPDSACAETLRLLRTAPAFGVSPDQ